MMPSLILYSGPVMSDKVRLTRGKFLAHELLSCAAAAGFAHLGLGKVVAIRCWLLCLALTAVGLHNYSGYVGWVRMFS